MILASIATSTLFIVALLTGGIGAVIGWYAKKRTEGTWKKDFQKAEKAQQGLEKKLMQKSSKQERLKKQLEGYKEKVHTLEKTQKAQQKEAQAKLVEQQNLVQETEAQVQQLTSNASYLQGNIDRHKQDYAKLNEKYKLDIADLKEWRKNRDSFNRDVKDTKNNLKVAQEKIASLTTSKEKLTKELDDARIFASKLRSLKAQNKKFSEQVEYWEQKHYDAHHELTATKQQLEDKQNQHQTLELQYQSMHQNNQQMLVKVQEFKDKFVLINNKYYALLQTK